MKNNLLVCILSVSFLFAITSCQDVPLDAKCYYKAPDLHIQNNNSYDWTDILIKIKIKKNLFANKTFIIQMKTFTSGNDTTINLNNVINDKAIRKDSLRSSLKDFKANIEIVTFQGKFSNTFSIKQEK